MDPTTIRDVSFKDCALAGAYCRDTGRSCTTDKDRGSERLSQPNVQGEVLSRIHSGMFDPRCRCSRPFCGFPVLEFPCDAFSLVQKTGNVACMEAPRSLLDKLQDLHTKPFGAVLLAVGDCVGEESKAPAAEPDFPLNNLLGGVCAAGLDTLLALDPYLPKRLASKGLPSTLPARSAHIRALASAPLTLIHPSSCTTCKGSYGCSSHVNAMFLPLPSNGDLDMAAPVLKCTTASCLTYSNQPLANCTVCYQGIMGLNCTLTKSAGFPPKSPLPEPWPLKGDLVYQYPFVARKEDVERGLDLTWAEAQDANDANASAATPAPSMATVVSSGPSHAAVSASQPMHWCSSCRRLQNKAGDQQRCSVCGIRGSWDVTFVSADPSDPKRRVYWPLGSIDARCSDGASKHEAGASPYCLLTDSLEAHMELSPLKMMEILKAQGVFTFEDVEVIPVKVGPLEVSGRKRTH